ncbi:hypothetical protein WMF18_17215 [Sorangium sp. So ce315]|uniref:hypothetical protein n=1 Tax=Sorangium sp. So ce315 TaxID=3133299 RepID=UPI003F608D61
MDHYRFDRPGFLAIAPDGIGGTFAAVPPGGQPNRMIRLPAPGAVAARHQAPAPRPSARSSAPLKAKHSARPSPRPNASTRSSGADVAAERARLLATRPDFSPAVRGVLQKAPIAEVRKAVKTWPRADRTVTPSAKARAAAASDSVKPKLGELEERVDRLENGHTMGPRTGGAEYRLYKLEKRVDSLEGREPTEPEKIGSADELPGRVEALEGRVAALEKRASDKQQMDARMGIRKPGQVRREGTAVVFGVMTPEDARKALAAGQRGRK